MPGRKRCPHCGTILQVNPYKPRQLYCPEPRDGHNYTEWRGVEPAEEPLKVSKKEKRFKEKYIGR